MRLRGPTTSVAGPFRAYLGSYDARLGVHEQVTRALSPVAAVPTASAIVITFPAALTRPMGLQAGSIAGHEDQGPRAGRLVHEVFTMGLGMFFSAQSRKTSNCARAVDPSARADQIFVVGSDGLAACRTGR